VTPSTETQVTCVECAAPDQGGRYCSNCGAPLPAPLVTANGGALPASEEEATQQLPVTEPQPTGRFRREAPASPPPPPPIDYAVQPAPPPPPPAVYPGQPAVPPPVAAAPAQSAQRMPRWVPFVLGGLLLVAAVAAVALVTGVFSQGTDWQAKSAQVLVPVESGNAQLSTQLTQLSTSSIPSGAQAALKSTSAQVTAANAELDQLDGAQPAVQQARRALAAESSYLTAVGHALTAPASSQLSGLAATAQDRLDAAVPQGQDNISGFDKLASWSSARQAHKQTRVSVRAFAGEVDSLLGRSAPSKSEISSLFTRMQQTVNGDPEITLAEATSGLSDVIANRSGLAGAARALSAPTGQATKVRALLATAFDDSLTDDRAIQDCLTQAQDVGLPDLFSSCLSSTAAQSDAASAAKQTFRDAYNKLRAKVGMSQISTDF
jgi:hypothetical protein